jgi:hypothetical protein
MKLIDRYVREIGRRLPQKSRTDIEKEIRSALEDMLEDRSKKESRAVDDELTIQVLKEYGKPEKVAASYLPERYLIGPQLFPIFWMVAQIVFIVLTVLAMVGLGFNLSGGEVSPLMVGKTIAESFGQYFSALMAALGNVVLVFALIQYFNPDLKFDTKEDEEWNPRDLPEVEDTDQVSRGNLIAEIVAIAVFGLVLFNLYPDSIGIYSFTEKGSSFIPFLSDAFFSYILWINLLWALQIGCNLILLQQMRWTSTTRWFWIAIKAGGIALAYAMLMGPSLINLTPEALSAGMDMPADAARIIATMAAQGVRIALVVSIVAGTVDILKSLVKLVRRIASPATA